jgi:hypothetical protein
MRESTTSRRHQILHDPAILFAAPAHRRHHAAAVLANAGIEPATLDADQWVAVILDKITAGDSGIRASAADLGAAHLSRDIPALHRVTATLERLARQELEPRHPRHPPVPSLRPRRRR